MKIRLPGLLRPLWFCWFLAAAGTAVACAKIELKQTPDSGPGGAKDAQVADHPNSGSGSDIGPLGSGGDAARDQAPQPCKNLQCQQVVCPNGGITSISGTAFAPNGTLPVYNVMVYVPNEPLAPFKEGVSCDRCGGAGAARTVASAISDEHGAFRITNVPVGKDIPLVFQLGKWRRQVTISTITACQDHAITDANLTRLPRNRREGDLPRIAMAMGPCDDLGCLLPEVGVDTDELGVAGDNKAVTFFSGSFFDTLSFYGPLKGPPNTTDVTNLWRNEAELSKYDMVLMSCECDEHPENKGPAAHDAMARYLAKGGRIFGTHYSYEWFLDSTDAKFAGALSISQIDGGSSNPLMFDTSFPKGKALADWLKFLDPTVTYGQIVTNPIYSNITSAMEPTTRVWATSPNGANGAGPRIVSVNTPAGLPAEQQCGRAALFDLHLWPRSMAPGGEMFPKVCGTQLNKGQQTLAFLFFDLAGCIQDENKPVAPPIIVP